MMIMMMHVKAIKLKCTVTLRQSKPTHTVSMNVLKEIRNSVSPMAAWWTPR